MRKFIMDKYNLIAFAIGLIPTILLYLFPPDAAVPFWAFSIVLFFLLIAIWMCAKLWLESKNDKAVPTISIIDAVTMSVFVKHMILSHTTRLLHFIRRMGISKN